MKYILFVVLFISCNQSCPYEAEINKYIDSMKTKANTNQVIIDSLIKVVMSQTAKPKK